MVLGFDGCGLGFGSPRDPVGVLCNLIYEHLTYERVDGGEPPLCWSVMAAGEYSRLEGWN
jgi:hypothetical protein